MIPTSRLFDQSMMTALLENDPVVQEYRSFFSFLDWSVVDQWQAERSARGRPGHPEAAYLKAFLIRQCEGLLYTSQLRRFLWHRTRCWSSNWAFISSLTPVLPTALMSNKPCLAATG